MKLLFIGNGVIGSNLAHILTKKHDITFLVKPINYETIKNNGIIIKNKFKKKVVDHYKLITKLEDNDIYDAIFISSRYSSLDSIVSLIKSNNSKTIIFIGNNIDTPKYKDLLSDKTILFGFYSCAGKKKGNTINSINKNKIIIGRIDNLDISNEFINKLFKDIKINLVIENKMDDYLKSHLASVLPLVYASYKVNGNLKLLKHDKKYSLLLIDAMLELYEVLISLNYEIIPYKDYLDYKNKKKLSAFIYRLIFATFIGKMCISDHALSAKDEFIILTEEFQKLIEKSNKETPLFNRLKEELYK